MDICNCLLLIFRLSGKQLLINNSNCSQLLIQGYCKSKSQWNSTYNVEIKKWIKYKLKTIGLKRKRAQILLTNCTILDCFTCTAIPPLWCGVYSTPLVSPMENLYGVSTALVTKHYQYSTNTFCSNHNVFLCTMSEQTSNVQCSMESTRKFRKHIIIFDAKPITN